MDQSKYRTLIKYITELGNPTEKNQAYKYMLVGL